MTQIFLDTANTGEIRGFISQGIGDGVTTNQKIILSEGSIDLKDRVVEICALKPEWPVSVETTTKTVDALVAEAEEFASWHHNVVVKVAMDKDGVALQVAKKLLQQHRRAGRHLRRRYRPGQLRGARLGIERSQGQGTGRRAEPVLRQPLGHRVRRRRAASCG